LCRTRLVLFLLYSYLYIFGFSLVILSRVNIQSAHLLKRLLVDLRKYPFSSSQRNIYRNSTSTLLLQRSCSSIGCLCNKEDITSKKHIKPIFKAVTLQSTNAQDSICRSPQGQLSALTVYQRYQEILRVLYWTTNLSTFSQIVNSNCLEQLPLNLRLPILLLLLKLNLLLFRVLERHTPVGIKRKPRDSSHTSGSPISKVIGSRALIQERTAQTHHTLELSQASQTTQKF
jgi:hypothetical protein